MALEFTGIRDEKGAAAYFIHDGSPDSEARMNKLMKAVEEQTKIPCILLSLNEQTGQKLVSLYDLRGTHMVVIVRDDDQLHHVWSDGDHFDPGRIAYSAERAG